ncbi:MAG: DNRLRE domain-containing protein [Candidatus Eisenbacteria bacterium]
MRPNLSTAWAAPGRLTTIVAVGASCAALAGAAMVATITATAGATATTRGTITATTTTSTTPMAAEEITLQPTQDTTLFFDPLGETASGSGPTLFLGTNSQGNTRRAVLSFDLSSLPSDVVVDGVALTLTVTNAPATDSVEVVVFPLTASWGEGASVSGGGSGAPALPGDATWIHRFYPDSAWAAPGGDFSPQSSGTFVLGPPGVYVFGGEGLLSDVQSWIDGSRSNHGWLLQGPETQVSTARGVASREATDDAIRPMLTVTYHPVSPVKRTGWGAIKSRFGQ